MKARLHEIDFIKGVAIISVILLHTLSQDVMTAAIAPLHIAQAVPLFLFITYYLSFKGLAEKEDGEVCSYYYSLKRVKRVLKEVAAPFFAVVALEVFSRIAINIYLGKFFTISELTVVFFGGGPGSYYFWIYLQLWILIPLIFVILKRFRWAGVIMVLLLSIALNVVCDRISITPETYRVLFIRYFFLSVPAFLLVDRENQGKKKLPIGVIAAITISCAYLVYFMNFDLSPYILNLGWVGQQWPAYFWTYLVFIGLFYLGHQLIGTRVSHFFEFLGKNSWYIFLTQMFLLTYFRIHYLAFIENDVIRNLVFITLVFFASLTPALLIQMFKCIRNKK